jgi:prevent-host-death family protein
MRIMKTVGVHKAKTTLSALLAKVEQGERIVITRHGKPIAQLTRIEPKPQRQAVLLRALPAWRDFTFDPAVFAAPTDEELAAERWPV